MLDQKGWKPAQLALRLGEHRNWVYSRLDGETAIKADELPRIAEALDADPCDFFDRKQEPAAADRMTRDWAQRMLTLSDSELGLLSDFLGFLQQRASAERGGR